MTSPTPKYSKMLLVFCDRTGMDGNVTYTTGPSQLTGDKNAKVQQYPTNVLRLCKDKSKRQIVLYLSGVGAETDFDSNTMTGALLVQALGTTVANKIRDAYIFIAQNYEDGDDICLFGFSRGSYIVRKVASLIDRIGILAKESLGYFFGIWLALDQVKTPTIPPGTKRTKIKCVGIWDTMGATFDVADHDGLNIRDSSPLPSVEVALHALALQENRKQFLPTLWDQTQLQLGPKQMFKQVLFPGAHSDVGGGHECHELSDIALIWMVGEIESFINIDTGFIQRCLQPSLSPWETSQPHSAYVELDLGEQVIIGIENRLDNGDIHTMLHQSLQFASTKLVKPESIITLNDLNKKFGSGWSPKWAPFNNFERFCRDNWGKPPPGPPITVKNAPPDASKVVAKL